MWRGHAQHRVATYIQKLKMLGLSARGLTHNDPEEPLHSFFEKMMIGRGNKEGCIKLEGRNIQFIELWRMDSKGGAMVTIAYLVRANIGDNEKDFNASWTAPFASFLKSGMKEYSWKGGLLAQSLNSDIVLKEMLMPYQRALKIHVESKNQYVAIVENLGDRSYYPDPEMRHIEAMERIAYHIRLMAPSIP